MAMQEVRHWCLLVGVHLVSTAAAPACKQLFSTASTSPFLAFASGVCSCSILHGSAPLGIDHCVCWLRIGFPAVFDVTRRETLDSLATKWMDDFKQYSTHPEAVQMVVGNKIDLVSGSILHWRHASVAQHIRIAVAV
jgi:hypothetical protein